MTPTSHEQEAACRVERDHTWLQSKQHTMNRELIHRPERPVFTCRFCPHSVQQSWGLLCRVFDTVVRHDEKVCIYRNVNNYKS